MQIVIVPAVVGGAGEEPATAVVGQHHAVGFERLQDDLVGRGEVVKGDIGFNYPAALARSLKIVEKQYRGTLFLFDKKYQIPVFAGRGCIAAPGQVNVTPNDGSAPFTLNTRNIVVDTGTRPRALKDLPYDGKRVINSDDAVVLEELGRAVAPVPYLTSAVVATEALLECAADGLLAELASGRRIGALAVALSVAPGGAHRTVRHEDGALYGELTGIAAFR